MRIYVVDLESVPTRYTCEWKSYLPEMLKREAKKVNADIEVINISGGEDSIEATPGAFLNFQQTNIYKNNQLNDIARRFSTEIQPGDKFLFADAWHTGILQLKYMSELLQIPIEIHALWHAGSYDPHDFLGRLIKDKSWTYNTERALYHAIDHNYFATQFHISLFVKTIVGYYSHYDATTSKKIIQTGWPMDYMPEVTARAGPVETREDIIVFPHRVAPEKQIDVFRDLAKSLPQYEFIVFQDNKLSKEQYHKLLNRTKIMWSANLQETLGISPYESALHGVYPLLPDRLSYTEMYPSKFLYPSEWTESFDAYLKHKTEIIELIEKIMNSHSEFKIDIENLSNHLLKKYFTATELVKELIKEKI